MRYYGLLCVLWPFWGFAQPNCNAFLYEGDTLQYRACKLIENVNDYQFSAPFQMRYDSALAICPYFAYAYREKSVAYLKSGDFLTWKYLIDKAVQYNAVGNLGYRGWCRYQFFHDYAGAIEDIERLEKMVNHNIGTGANGDYHLIMTKALCYSALGEKQRAIDIMEAYLKQLQGQAGLYDHYQLGVTYCEVGNFGQAMYHFSLQNDRVEWAETAYQQAKVYLAQGNTLAYQQAKAQAVQRYQAGKVLFDPYTHHANKVFKADIEGL